MYVQFYTVLIHILLGPVEGKNQAQTIFKELAVSPGRKLIFQEFQPRGEKHALYILLCLPQTRVSTPLRAIGRFTGGIRGLPCP